MEKTAPRRLKDVRKLKQNRDIEKVFQRRRVEQSGLDHIWSADVGGPYFGNNQAKKTTEKNNQNDTIAQELIDALNVGDGEGNSYASAKTVIKTKLTARFPIETTADEIKRQILNGFNDDPETLAVAEKYFVGNPTRLQLLERLAQSTAKYLFPGNDNKRRITKKNDLTRNGNNNFILFVLDIFSRYLWTQPMKSTKPDEVKNAFSAILRKASPRRPRAYLWNDEGAEFENIADALPLDADITNRPVVTPVPRLFENLTPEQRRIANNEISITTKPANYRLPFETNNTDGNAKRFQNFEGINHMNKVPPFITQTDQYHTHSRNKAFMAERVIKTIQDMLELMPELLQPTHPKSWNLKLTENGVSKENVRAYEQELINEKTCPFFSDWTIIKNMTMLEYATHRYNNNYHRSLIIHREKQKPIKHTPTSASMPENEKALLDEFYRTSYVPQGKKQFQIGDIVRVVLEDKVKNKGQLIWSEDKYKVAKIKNSHPYTYKVRPEDGGVLLKRSFYSQEMWKV